MELDKLMETVQKELNSHNSNKIVDLIQENKQVFLKNPNPITSFDDALKSSIEYKKASEELSLISLKSNYKVTMLNYNANIENWTNTTKNIEQEIKGLDSNNVAKKSGENLVDKQVKSTNIMKMERDLIQIYVRESLKSKGMNEYITKLNL